eukprot:TRINITY_DN3984_c0_g1_i1.p1 TRINITY_DN3984_c0_g1~~TRINITY_DN3984_c0_g1_i1.p1  ORF type:complete len:1361 (+),score=261.61 TRINITY_DN3984_c0_g1_i1:127-4209(+)
MSTEYKLRSIDVFVKSAPLEILPQIAPNQKTAPKPPSSARPNLSTPRSTSHQLSSRPYTSPYEPSLEPGQSTSAAYWSKPTAPIAERPHSVRISRKNCVAKDFVNHPFHQRPKPKKLSKRPKNQKSTEKFILPTLEHHELHNDFDADDEEWVVDNPFNPQFIRSRASSLASMKSFRFDRSFRSDSIKTVTAITEEVNQQTKSPRHLSTVRLDLNRKVEKIVEEEEPVKKAKSPPIPILPIEEEAKIETIPPIPTQRAEAKPRKPYMYPLVYNETVTDSAEYDIDEFFSVLKHGKEQHQVHTSTHDAHHRGYRAKTYKNLNLSQIQALEAIFKEIDVQGKVNKKQFLDIMEKLTEDSDQVLKELFRKVDDGAMKSVTYEQFVSYIMQEWASAEDAALSSIGAAPSPSLIDPQNCHRHMIARLRVIPELSIYATCGRDGIVNIWDAPSSKKVQTLFPFEDASQREKHICYRTATSYLPAPRRSQVFFQNRLSAQPTVKSSQVSMVEQPLSRIYAQLTKCTPWPTDVAYSPSSDLLIVSTLDQSLTTYTRKKETTYIPSKSISLDVIPMILKVVDFGESTSYKDVVFVGCSRGGIAWYDSRDWTRIGQNQIHMDCVTDLRHFTRLGMTSCSLDSTIRIFNFERPETQTVLKGHKGGVQSIDYSPMYKMLFSGGTGNEVIAWDPIRRNPIVRLWGHYGAIVSVMCNEEEHQLITCSVDKMIKIWDVRRMQCIRTIFDMNKYKPENVMTVAAFDDKRHALVTGGHLLRSWSFDVSRNDTISDVSRSAPHQQHIVALLYSECFKQMISVSMSGLVRVWTAATGKLDVQFKVTDVENVVTTAALDSRQRRLITCSSDGESKIWNFNCGSNNYSFAAPKRKAFSHVAWMKPTIHRPIIGVYDGKRLGAWPDQQADAYVSSRMFHSNDADISAMCVSTAVIVTGYVDGSIRFWDVDSKTFQKATRLTADGDLQSECASTEDEQNENLNEVKNLIVLPGRQFVVAYTADGFIHLLSAAETRLLRAKVMNMNDKITSMCSAVITSCEEDNEEGDNEEDDDSSQYTSDKNDEENHTSFQGPTDECYFVTGDAKGIVKIWDASKMLRMDEIPQPVAQWQAHKAAISGLVPVAGGYIASCSLDGKVLLWDQEGRLIRHMKDLHGITDPDSDEEQAPTIEEEEESKANANNVDEVNREQDQSESLGQVENPSPLLIQVHDGIRTDERSDAKSHASSNFQTNGNLSSLSEERITNRSMSIEQSVNLASIRKQQPPSSEQIAQMANIQEENGDIFEDRIRSPVPDTRYEGFVVPLVVNYSDLMNSRYNQKGQGSRSDRSGTMNRLNLMTLVDPHEDEETQFYNSVTRSFSIPLRTYV